YADALRSRPVIREDADSADDTPERLRSIAGRVRTARDADEHASAILATRIFLSAGTFEFDEALRFESKAARLRGMARTMAADADLLANAASNADGLDISTANLAIEASLSMARERLGRAEEELDQLENQREKAEAQREMHLAEAAEYERYAIQFDEEGVDKGPRAGLDEINEAIFNRQEANSRRIAAANDEISILTVSPIIAHTNAERTGQLAVADSAREERRAAEGRLEEARAYANDVRRELERISNDVALLVRESSELETSEVLPRLENAIGDYEAAAQAARTLTRGGTRNDAAAGWRTTSNAQFNAGRAHWEIATVLERRTDVLGRLARGGVLVDPGAVGQDVEAALSARDESLDAAKASFEAALESIDKVPGSDADTARLKQSIQTAIDALAGVPAPEPVSTGQSAGTSSSRTTTRPATSGGGGFGTPAELANFLSDPTSQMDPRSFQRLESALRATTPQAKSISKLLTAGSVMLPLFEAMTDKFGVSAMDQMGDGADMMANSPLPTNFKIQSVEGDTAIMTSGDGQQSLVLTKTSSGWVIDLDATVKRDPQAAMMAEMIVPMIDQMMQPLSKAVDGLAARVRAGDFSSPDEAMEAFLETMAKSMPGGGGGGGGFGGF
ncbi:MAG: hypothetical protein VX672_09100, partial [Planctomycetota bacterium]|nr:hypothetical protein [Planctomycetota bacterium]